MEEPQKSIDNAFEEFAIKRNRGELEKKGGIENNCFLKQKMYFISRTQYF